jgi:hypothetical protein
MPQAVLLLLLLPLCAQAFMPQVHRLLLLLSWHPGGL